MGLWYKGRGRAMKADDTGVDLVRAEAVSMSRRGESSSNVLSRYHIIV